MNINTTKAANTSTTTSHWTTTAVALLPEAGIYLTVKQSARRPVKGATVQQFVRQFQRSWSRLPPDDRERVLSLWPVNLDLFALVTLEHRVSGPNLAAKEDAGELFFSAASFEPLDDEEQCALIAYALAHVVQRLTGWCDGCGVFDTAPKQSPKRKSVWEERWTFVTDLNARVLAERWGFKSFAGEQGWENYLRRCRRRWPGWLDGCGSSVTDHHAIVRRLCRRLWAEAYAAFPESRRERRRDGEVRRRIDRELGLSCQG